MLKTLGYFTMIRLATTNDIPRLLDLLHEVDMVHHNLRPDLFKPHTTKYDEQQLRAILADPRKAVFVYDDHNVWGYAFAESEEVSNDRLLQDRRSLYIDDICVDEKARGKHVGKALFEHVRHFAQSIGCQTITLNVWAGNEPAENFYKSVGMHVQKTCMEIALD